MKKATITILTSAALAFAIPLYATDEPGMKTDSQQPAGVTQQQSDQLRTNPMQTNPMQTGQMKSGDMQSGKMQTGHMQSGQIINAESLKGMKVLSQGGEEIGEIDKVKIDAQSGDVQFVTISQGAILGMGGKEVAIPLSAFEFSDEKATLTVDQSKLENVPEQTAEITDSDYQRNLETHYGVAPAWDKGNLDDSTDTQKIDQDPTKIDQDPTKPRK